MQDRYYETCASEELKEQKVYYVQKCKVEHHTYDWVFRAYFKKGICGRKKFLSELNAIDGGLCVATINLSPKAVQGCGLATKMMELCYSDIGIGSLNPAKDYNFKLKGLEKWRDMAILNCEHIVFTNCNPAKPTPIAGCAAYMTAALNTGHRMMFTFPTGKDPKGEMDVINVEDEGKPQLKKNAESFVSDHGNQWYFCRCKDDRISECEAMQKI